MGSAAKFAVALLLLCVVMTSSADALAVNSPRAILVTPERAESLWNRAANTRHAPASLAKVLTAVLAIESGRLDEHVLITPLAAAVGGSSLHLRSGERHTLRELVYAAMLISANDASAAIAEHLGGSLAGFSAMMNARAGELGMRNSRFANAHGLPESGQFSTAADLARLGLHAASLPQFLAIAGRERFTMTNGRVLVNQNRLLGTLPGVVGGKTGYTDEAGQCLLVIAKRDNLTMVSVVLGAQGAQMWSDSTALIEHGFAAFQREILIRGRQTLGVVEIPLAGQVLLVAERELTRTITRAERGEYSTELRVKPRLFPPLRPGDKLGEVVVTQGGQEIGRVHVTVPAYIPLLTSTRLLGLVVAISLGVGMKRLMRRRRKCRK
ncbi:MAG: D-alanyl-D-alanine carboxypeptidase DacB [Firmicutes bacterium]|nr:D-alanyl-D-alanine carboxypeptidase DacB [candidate division NPL-UPA2 bacterium]